MFGILSWMAIRAKFWAMLGSPWFWLLAVVIGWTWLAIDYGQDLGRAEIQHKWDTHNRTVQDLTQESDRAVDLADGETAAQLVEMRARLRVAMRTIQSQRDHIPLSQACNACKVPIQRLGGAGQ